MISGPKDGSLVHPGSIDPTKRQDMVGATTWSFVNLGAEKSLEIMSFVSQKPLGVGIYGDDILWMEEILHQLVDGLSHCNPIIYSVL